MTQKRKITVMLERFITTYINLMHPRAPKRHPVISTPNHRAETSHKQILSCVPPRKAGRRSVSRKCQQHAGDFPRNRNCGRSQWQTTKRRRKPVVSQRRVCNIAVRRRQFNPRAGRNLLCVRAVGCSRLVMHEHERAIWSLTWTYCT